MTLYTGDNYQAQYYSEQLPHLNGKCFNENFNIELEQDKMISIPASGGILDLKYQHDKEKFNQQTLGTFKLTNSFMQLKINSITVDIITLLQKDIPGSNLIIVPNIFFAVIGTS